MNVIAIVWISFEVVLFSMPTVLPVTSVTMNYASVVLVGFMSLAAVWYFAYAKKGECTIPTGEKRANCVCSIQRSSGIGWVVIEFGNDLAALACFGVCFLCCIPTFFFTLIGFGNVLRVMGRRIVLLDTLIRAL